MARRSFRDRFFTPRVAEAIMSPLGILLAGVGTAAGILVGLPVLAAAGIGVAAWGGRVLAAAPGNAPSAKVSPSSLTEPWRSYGVEAEDAKRRFDRVVESVAPGPLRERLELLSGRLDDGVDETWRIARRGHEITGAIAEIDTVTAEAELVELRLRLGSGAPSPAQAQTMEALEAQLASAGRLTALAERSRERLRLLDARFDELLARTVEVSVGSGDTDVLGEDVDGLVNELEALRMAMDEADRAGRPDALPQPEPPA
jgi:hypothetical protein